jgi:hypothetical protein
MNTDGSAQKNISNSELFDNWFWWSPDSTQIYVTSTQGQDPQNLVWSAAIVNVDGSNRITFVFGSNINWK